MLCPECKTSHLAHQKEKELSFLICESCPGRALKSAALKQAVHPEKYEIILAKIQQESKPSALNCPSCMGGMVEAPTTNETHSPTMFYCQVCEYSWVPTYTYRLITSRVGLL
jgi:uncharacterized protein YbaR (Trm112 family)